MQELQPPKPRKVDQAKAAEQRAYERSYNRARKDAAQAKGAAAGMADAESCWGRERRAGHAKQQPGLAVFTPEV